MEISVCPTVASVDWPNPLKMSAMPHTPKLMIRTPITTAIMLLPSQFDEALRIPRSMGPTCLQEGTGSRRGNSGSNSQTGGTGLKRHHKVAAAPSQPQRRGHLKRVFGRGGAGRSLEVAVALC